MGGLYARYFPTRFSFPKQVLIVPLNFQYLTRARIDQKFNLGVVRTNHRNFVDRGAIFDFKFDFDDGAWLRRQGVFDGRRSGDPGLGRQFPGRGGPGT